MERRKFCSEIRYIKQRKNIIEQFKGKDSEQREGQSRDGGVEDENSYWEIIFRRFKFIFKIFLLINQ